MKTFRRFKSHFPCYLSSIFMTGFICVQLVSAGEPAWKAKFNEELPLMGHRNWIAIVDSAYPLQVSPGVETIATGSDQLEVLQAVLDRLSKTKHVQPVIFTDLELSKVGEADAVGIGAYRDRLAKVLGDRPVQSLLHEKIISQLDEAGKTFHIIILKTNLTLPYTSVFLRLDCGYWNTVAEQRLRASIRPEAK